MEQSPAGGLHGPPSERHVGGCAIYSETSVLGKVALGCVQPSNAEDACLNKSSVALAQALALEVRGDAWKAGTPTLQ